MRTTTICVSCKRVVRVNKKLISEKTVNVKDTTASFLSVEIPLYVTTYTCPVCGNEEVKLLDNDETKAIVQKLVQAKIRMLHGKPFGDRMKKRVSNLGKELNTKRKILDTTYRAQVDQLICAD